MTTHARANALREFLLDCAALVWPARCLGCGRVDRTLCARCAGELRKADRGVNGGSALTGKPTFVAGPYEGVPRAALIALKHGSAFGLVRVLGARLALPLACAVAEARWGPPLLVTVPSRKRRVRERGFRHVDELVRVAVRVAGVRARVSHALAPLPGRTGQVGLHAREREANAARVRVRRQARVQGREVVLIDDICTTGASARAAIDELERAGARVVAVAFLCISLRRDTRGQ